MRKNVERRARAKLPIIILGLTIAFMVVAAAAWWWAQNLSFPLPVYRTAQPATGPEPSPALPVKPAIDWQQVDQQIITALLQAESAAETTATQKLDAWITVLMRRVDEDFLEWYFSYWTQQKLGIKGAWRWTLDQVIGIDSEFAEQITEQIQEEFAWRVLRPEEAQLELEQIAHAVLETYSRKLQAQLLDIPDHYQIPQPEWEGYLQDIAVLTATSEGNRRVSLSLKAVTAGSVGGGVMLATAFATPLQNLGSKTSAKLAVKAAAQVASKTGAQVASRTGGKLLGLIIGIGIVIWEAWDHEHTKNLEQPKLRQTIVDYFEEVKKSLLYDPGSGIIAMLDIMEENIVASLRTRPVKTIAEKRTD
ncbi:MAG: hypothetical protein ACREOO_27540 [bacterium]